MPRNDDGLPIRARRFAVAVLVVGTAMAVLDGSIANVALPTIARELRVDPASSVWVINAYQVAVTATLVPFASLGEVRGFRIVYAGGIALFTLGSLACAMAHALPWLIAARVLQGVGGSALMSTSPALYRTIYPSAQLGRAVGISALTVAASASAGPTLGGAVLAVAPWPWLFAINVPIGIAGVLFAWRTLPREGGRGGPYDFTSALLGGPAIALLVVALDGAGRHVAGPLIVLELCASAVLAFAFVARQRGLKQPMLALDLFKIPRFALAAATSLASFIAQGLAFVALPFLFQGGLGYSALASGLLFTPWPLAIACVAPVSGRLSDRVSPPVLSTIGLGILALGLGLLAALGSQAAWYDIAWRAIVCGVGFGLFQAPNNREILGSAPRSKSGSASGILASVRVTGQSLGAAVVAIALAAAGATFGTTRSPSVVAPAHVALWLSAGCAALAMFVSALRLRRD